MLPCSFNVQAAIHRVLPQDNDVAPHSAIVAPVPSAAHQNTHRPLNHDVLNDLDGVPDPFVDLSTGGVRNIYGPGELANGNHT